MPPIFSIDDCDLDLALYSRGSCFRTLSDYSNDETCTIIVETDCVLEVKSFDTEAFYDNLNVNGVGYSGSTGPDGVFVEAGQEIEFSSDVSNTGSGFNICGSPSSAPSDDSIIDTLTSNENIYYIIAAVLLVCCLAIFCYMTRSSKQNDRRVPNAEVRRNRARKAQGGEKDISKSDLLRQQSVEGVVDVVKIQPDARPKRRHQRDESDNIRPVFSFSDRDEVPIVSFESDRSANNRQQLEEMPSSPDIELAPPAEAASQSDLASPADIAPPADLPPPYEGPEASPAFDPEEQLGEGKQKARGE